MIYAQKHIFEKREESNKCETESVLTGSVFVYVKKTRRVCLLLRYIFTIGVRVVSRWHNMVKLREIGKNITSRMGVEIMKLVLLIGDTAVGKMTVGQELMKMTGLRLFHNHMTIETVIEIFGCYDGKTVSRLREVIFEEFVKSNNEGMIFTYMWAFDVQADWDYIKYVTDLFEQNGAEVYCAELVAPQEVRLQRNETENRLENKASKRNLEFSKKLLLAADAEHRMESLDGEIPFHNYIKINNSELEAAEVAAMIKKQFNL